MLLQNKLASAFISLKIKKTPVTLTGVFLFTNWVLLYLFT